MSTKPLQLYDYWRSSASFRVRIGLNLKGIPYESLPVNLQPAVSAQFNDTYLSINPQGRVPALSTPQGVLVQSLAILEWLEECYPQPPFLVGDALLRARIRAFAMTIACDVHPLSNVSVIGQVQRQFSANDDALAVWHSHWISRAFAALEREIASGPEVAFTFSDAPTLADILLVPQMANARRFGVDISPYPRLCAVDTRARQHPAFIQALPENQPDAPS